MQEQAAMDRDFVLNVKAPNAKRSFVMTGKDGKRVRSSGQLPAVFSGLAS